MGRDSACRAYKAFTQCHFLCLFVCCWSSWFAREDCGDYRVHPPPHDHVLTCIRVCRIGNLCTSSRGTLSSQFPLTFVGGKFLIVICTFENHPHKLLYMCVMRRKITQSINNGGDTPHNNFQTVISYIRAVLLSYQNGRISLLLEWKRIACPHWNRP